jgi:hypothetical protein
VERLAKRKARFQRALAEMERLGLKEDGQRMTMTEPQAEALWRQIAHNLMLLIGEWKPLVLQDPTEG